ncbi:uncharacterized protein B0T23DRAFT_427235 [Neurospora hispaniola]|uniref:Uncharacterized protein n=1 Tax=Neurospora hispaniola TaxID=588809 RepID=A0AAJ0I997_9PEZI|nr:hypothetical protein B0T23DRAFT_427235 [Neurospora hispaniola]
MSQPLDLNSHRPSVKIRLALINFCHSEVFTMRRKGEVEEICRDQADLFDLKPDDLGLNYVVIRQGLHETRNLTHEGIPVTFYDPETENEWDASPPL